MQRLHKLVVARDRLQAEWDEKFAELAALDEALKGIGKLIQDELLDADKYRENKLMDAA